MSWLTPLGFLGLAGIIALIIIYLIKPNYQQKMITSTYVWKLSLKLRKKKLPINRLRNILILICQILIITTCALILAQPVIKAEAEEDYPERIFILDASGDMLAEEGGSTRFETAVQQVKNAAQQILAQDGYVTVIATNQKLTAESKTSQNTDPHVEDKPYYLVQKAHGAEAVESVNRALDEAKCTFGVADMDAAMDLAEPVLEANPKAQIMVYTGTDYIQQLGVTVVNVATDDEWNAAILNCEAELVENLYTINISVACYGADKNLTVYCVVSGVNGRSEDLEYRENVQCTNDETVLLSIDTRERGDNIDSYETIHVYVREEDSFGYDNDFYLYDQSNRTPIKVLYRSPRPNTFVRTFVRMLKNNTNFEWNIVDFNDKQDAMEAYEGYDVYIFEHEMPADSLLPEDGVIFLINPDRSSNRLGLQIAKDPVTAESPLYFAMGETHAINNNVKTEYLDDKDPGKEPIRLTLSQYVQVTQAPGYSSLMTCNGDPLIMVKNEAGLKVMTLNFDLNFSTIAVTPAFPLIMYNAFTYFLPNTVSEFLVDVNTPVTVNSRGNPVRVNGMQLGKEITFDYDECPGTVWVTVPGTYTASQTILSGTTVTERFFAKVAASESNLFRTEDTIAAPYVEERVESADRDLLIWFAAALVFLLFAEWWLQSREHL